MRRVYLFVPCYVEMAYPRVARNTVEILEAAGCTVEYPLDQTCCGQPAHNCGHAREAQAVARRCAEVFGHATDGHIVAPSGSCIAMLRHEYQGLGLTLPVPALELSEYLVQILERVDLGARLDRRAALALSCHLERVLGAGDCVRTLLDAVKGLEVVSTTREGQCCGFGGVFSVMQPEVSVALGNEKLQAIREAGVDLLITSDASCGMHLEGLAERQGQDIQVVHYAEVLAG